MAVAFVDLKAQYRAIKPEMDAAIQDVIDNTAFIRGPFVEKFEKEFAAFCGAKYAGGLSSGTAALFLPMLALGLGEGDEVITVPNTFCATVEAVARTGAKTVFVDIDKDTYNIDAGLVEKAITEKTKAILPVHLFGQPADMDPLLAIAKKHNLLVIEDACQAHGAKYKGTAVGAFGAAAAFSFYPGKNLGCYGDGGAFTTNDAELAEKVARLADHGSKDKYKHLYVGYNNRLDGIQGAVLSVKLRHIAAWSEARRRNAALYTRHLEGADVVTPVVPDFAEPVFHLYVLRTTARQKLQDGLKAKGIASGIHYPVPLHLQPAFEPLGYKKGDFPVAERYAEEILSLPMFPELKEEDIALVAETIKSL